MFCIFFVPVLINEYTKFFFVLLNFEYEAIWKDGIGSYFINWDMWRYFFLRVKRHFLLKFNLYNETVFLKKKIKFLYLFILDILETLSMSTYK